MKLVEVVKLIRAEHGVMVSIAVLAGYLASGGLSAAEAVIACIATFFVEAALFAANDIFNLEEDRLNRPDRPLVRGSLSVNEAWIVTAASATLGILLSLLLGLKPFLLAFAALIVGFLYNRYLKRMAFFGNLAVAWLTSLSFLFGAFCATENPPAKVTVYTLIAFSANVGREIIKGIRDLEGDQRAGICTLPCEIGIYPSAAVSSAFIFLAIALSIAVAPYFSLAYLVLILLTDLLFGYSAVIVLVSPTKSAEKARKLTLMGMSLAVLALLLSNFY